MAADILIMEAANLFIGTADPEKSKHLKIENLTLPTLDPVVVEHMPGGGALGMEISMGILKPLQPGFKLVGFDEEAYAAAGVGSNTPTLFTARGHMRRKSDGKTFSAVATIKGILGKIAPDQFQRSQLLGHDHSIVEVTRYKLTVNDTDWFEVDAFATVRKAFGVDYLSDLRANLGLI